MTERYVFSLVFLGLLVVILLLAFFIDRLRRRSVRRARETEREATERLRQMQEDATEQKRIELFGGKLAPPGGWDLKNAIEEPKYVPVFAGVVDNSDRDDIPVVVYKNRETGHYYLEYNRSEDLYPLSVGTVVTVWDDTVKEEVHMKVEKSATWNGTATGTWRDLRVVNAR